MARRSGGDELSAILPRTLFGSSYYPPHHGPEDWPRDLDRMVEAGLMVIRSGELLASWDRIEVAKHEYDFAWLDRLFELAGERGIQILLGTGTCCPPIWMASEYPDLPVLSREGIRYTTGGVWSWACRNHPAFRVEIERWLKVLAERYGDRPELLGWQIDNEPSHPCQPKQTGELDLYCYCEHTEERFREWLQERYESPQALSEAWRWVPTNHRYSDWSQVRAPRALPSEWGVVTAWLDWRRFVVDDLADFIGWQRELLHELTPEQPTCTNVLAFSRFDPFGVLMGHDARRLARVVDAIGFDIYPGIRQRFLKEPELVPLYADYARSVARQEKRELWITEAESGPLNGWVLGPDHPTNGDDLTRLNTECIGAGARLFLYQGYREWNCIPLHWGALVDLHGERTERFSAAAGFAHHVGALTPELHTAETPPADVALLHDYDNAILNAGLGSQSFLAEALAGAYLSLAGAGYPVDIVDFDQLNDLTCRLLILPFTVLLPATAGERIAAFVKRGGTVLGFAKAAMVDGQGWYWDVRPGAGLSTIFGAEEELIEATREEVPVEIAATDILPGWAGGTASGFWHRQLLRPAAESTVLGRFADGSAAFVHNRYGNGQAFLAGTHFDLAARDHPSARALLVSVAEAAGANRLFEPPPSHDSPARVYAHLRRQNGRGLLTITSTSDEPVELVLNVSTSRLRDALTDKELPLADPLRVSVAPRGSRVLVLEEIG